MQRLFALASPQGEAHAQVQGLELSACLLRCLRPREDPFAGSEGGDDADEACQEVSAAVALGRTCAGAKRFVARATADAVDRALRRYGREIATEVVDGRGHRALAMRRLRAAVVARVAGAGDVAHDERVDDPQVRGVLDEAGEDLRDDRRDRRGEALGEPGRRARQVRQRTIRDGARRLPGRVPLRRPALARAVDLADDARRVREDALGRPDVLFPVRAARQRVICGRAATIDAGRRRVALRSLVALAPMLPAVPLDGSVQRRGFEGQRCCAAQN